MYFIHRNTLHTGVIFAEGRAQVTAQHEGKGHAGWRITQSVLCA